MSAADSTNPFTDPGRAPAYPGVGFRLGEYVIKDTLGHGSMATVFLAEDGTGHDVAIKIFQEGPGVSPTMLERFRREADATKKLRRHPNIMKVYATGKQDLWHYIVMEPICNSCTLEDALENTELTIEAIVRLMLKATVVNLEVKKPAGTWEKVAGQAYASVQADPETGRPTGLGFETIPSFTMLMRENKDRMAFARMTGKP